MKITNRSFKIYLNTCKDPEYIIVIRYTFKIETVYLIFRLLNPLTHDDIDEFSAHFLYLKQLLIF